MENIKDRTGTKWSREETILAFELYTRTPFGKIMSTNPDIIALAKQLGRTPSSVSLKMSNLAHYDPELRKRNVNGMSHSSKLDEQIFVEFCQNLEELAYQAEIIKKEFGFKNLKIQTIEKEILNVPPGEYRERLVKTRIGQSAFRNAIISSYNSRCCVTGLKTPSLLIASHIKPWSVSNDLDEKTNPCNGLCLNALHDRAFDKGLITIDKSFKVIVSSQLKNAEMDDFTKDWILHYEGETIALPDKFIPRMDFIEYHNDVIFQH